jgi:hypothetical protein
MVTGVPNEEKGLIVIGFTLRPSLLKENALGAGAEDAVEFSKLNARLFLVSAGGGVLGAAPNEKGVVAGLGAL